MLKNHLLPALTVTFALLGALILSFTHLLGSGNLRTTNAAGFTALSSSAVIATIGPEINGLAGPAAVNCSSATYQAARITLDQQRSAWMTAAEATLPGAVAIPAWISGPSDTAVNAPYRVTQPDGFAMVIAPVDLAPVWGFQSGSAATGVPAYESVQINGSASGCTMQDNAPKPSSTVGGDYYFCNL